MCFYFFQRKRQHNDQRFAESCGEVFFIFFFETVQQKGLGASVFQRVFFMDGFKLNRGKNYQQQKTDCHSVTAFVYFCWSLLGLGKAYFSCNQKNFNSLGTAYILHHWSLNSCCKVWESVNLQKHCLESFQVRIKKKNNNMNRCNDKHQR